MKILKAQEAEKADAEEREDMDADGAGKESNIHHATECKKNCSTLKATVN